MFSHQRLVHAAFALCILGAGPIGCKKAAGEFKQDCYPNQTCNTGLQCVGGVCVGDDATTARAPSTQERLPEVNGAADSGSVASHAQPEEAIAAYRSMVDAWNAGDSTGYFAAFAPVLDCYYNEASYASSALQRSSRGRHFRDSEDTVLRIRTIDVLASTPDEVTLRESGTYTSRGETKNHEKIVVLRRRDGQWKVVTEVSRSAHGCYPGATFSAPSAQPSGATENTIRCDRYVGCFAACDQIDDEDRMMACYGRCESKAMTAPPPYRLCTPVVDAKRRPCDAARECLSVCGTYCPSGCNGEMECASDCEEALGAACPSAFR